MDRESAKAKGVNEAAWCLALRAGSPTRPVLADLVVSQPRHRTPDSPDSADHRLRRRCPAAAPAARARARAWPVARASLAAQAASGDSPRAARPA